MPYYIQYIEHILLAHLTKLFNVKSWSVHCEIPLECGEQ